MARDGPRNPSSSYSCFVQARRQDFKEKHPYETVGFSQFSKICSMEWKALSDSEKERYVRMAREDKARYEKEMKLYVPPDVGKKAKKAKRDPNAPKRALSAFFWFCNEERNKVKAALPAGAGVGDVAKECANRWNALSSSAKVKYEDLAAKDKARYEQEMAAYRSK